MNGLISCFLIPTWSIVRNFLFVYRLTPPTPVQTPSPSPDLRLTSRKQKIIKFVNWVTLDKNYFWQFLIRSTLIKFWRIAHREFWRWPPEPEEEIPSAIFKLLAAPNYSGVFTSCDFTHKKSYYRSTGQRNTLYTNLFCGLSTSSRFLIALAGKPLHRTHIERIWLWIIYLLMLCIISPLLPTYSEPRVTILRQI